MIYFLTVMHTAAAFFTVYNSCRLAELVTDRRGKRGYILPAVYIILSAAYIFIHIAAEKPWLDIFLLAAAYICLFLCVKRASDSGIFRTVYIVLMYLSADSLLLSLEECAVSIFREDYSSSYIKAVISLINGVLLFLAIHRIDREQNPFRRFDVIPRHIYILILLALFFSGGLIESLLTITNIRLRVTLSRAFTVISIVLLIFIIDSLVFYCISKVYLENVSSMLEKQVNVQVDYYKKADKLNNELRNFRHDYKNHLLCVQGLLDGGEYDEAKDYISSITLRQTASGREFSSGNTIVNAILADKAEAAESIGAELRFQGIVYEDIPAVDVCTIFANALDNALEACAKLTDGEPKIISVKCSYIKHIQFINITNPTAENVTIVNNSVQTSKEDKNSHGIGLYNIRRTVEKYDGEFDISCKDGLFMLDVGFKVD